MGELRKGSEWWFEEVSVAKMETRQVFEAWLLKNDQVSKADYDVSFISGLFVCLHQSWTLWYSKRRWKYRQCHEHQETGRTSYILCKSW